MEFMDRCIEGVMDLWRGYLEHPFVKGIQDGTLDGERFRYYIVQDSIYLKEYTRVFGMGIYRARRLSDMRYFYQSIRVVMEEESCTRSKYLEGFSISEEELDALAPAKANQAYIDFMMDKAEHGQLPEVLMAVLPCMLSYCYIGTEMVRALGGLREDHPFYSWILDYANEDYVRRCREWEEFADRSCRGASPKRQQGLMDIFRQASLHEQAFWDMSYNMEGQE